MVATFHGYSFRHLRRNPQAAGLDEQFPLWDTAQQRMSSVRARCGGTRTKTFSTLSAVPGTPARRGTIRRQSIRTTKCWRGGAFFRFYERALAAAGAIDFATWWRVWCGRWTAIAITRRRSPGPATTSGRRIPGHQSGPGPLIDRFVTARRKTLGVAMTTNALCVPRADVRYILEFTKKYRGATVHVSTAITLDRANRDCAQRLIKRNACAARRTTRPSPQDAGELLIRAIALPSLKPPSALAIAG